MKSSHSSSLYSIYKAFEKLYDGGKGIRVTRHKFQTELPDYVHQLFSLPDQRVVSEESIKGVERREFVLLGVHVRVDFIHLHGTPWKRARMNELIVWAQRALYFLMMWANDKRADDAKEPKEIHIVLANSPVKKVVPGVCAKSRHRGIVCGERDVFTAFHVNSGLTTFASGIGAVSNKVLVYREEEMVKVLIHELVHGLGYDFRYWEYGEQEDALKRAFPQWCRPQEGSRVALSECFTDTVACWLTAHFFVLYKAKGHGATHVSCRVYLSRVARVLALQHEYLVNQAAKITREYAAGRVIGEKTHVFSYYIAKAAIFSECEYVLSRWHPSKNQKLDWVAFYGYVTRAVKSRAFKKALALVEPYVDKTVGKEGMRMQRIDL
jgi:hypothetical protein